MKTLLGAILLVFSANQAEAAKTFRICNGKPYAISVAVAYGEVTQDATFGTGHEILAAVVGWKNLAATECYDITLNPAQPVLYAYARSKNGALFPEKNGRRLCIHYTEGFKNDTQLEINEHVTEGCRVKGQWAVPFFQVVKPHFTF